MDEDAAAERPDARRAETAARSAQLQSLDSALQGLEVNVREAAGAFVELSGAVRECADDTMSRARAHSAAVLQSSENTAAAINGAIDETRAFMERCRALDKELDRLGSVDALLADTKRQIVALENIAAELLPARAAGNGGGDGGRSPAAPEQ